MKNMMSLLVTEPILAITLMKKISMLEMKLRKITSLKFNGLKCAKNGSKVLRIYFESFLRLF